MRYYLVPALIFLVFFARAQSLYLVAPSQANALITQNDDSNYIYVNSTVQPLNKLFVFFPGSGAAPKAYKEILKTAANMGYHAIGLSYNNDETISSLCSGQPSDCQGLARTEIFYGQDVSTQASVDSTHCIRRRLTDLLQYLDGHYPSAGWGQYLIGQDSIDWSKVCVSGHSQGAGMASIIAYWYSVDRAVFFANGGDWSVTALDVADWMKQSSATPVSKKYAFAHMDDELLWNNFNITPNVWDTLGLYAYGQYLNVDTLSNDYYGRHCFTSLQAITGISPIKYHNCPVADINTPFNGNTPVYQPLWQYMLGSQATMVQDINNKLIRGVSPNPASSTVSLYLTRPCAEVIITNILGQRIYIQSVHASKVLLDVSGYPPGQYFIIARSPESIATARIAIK